MLKLVNNNNGSGNKNNTKTTGNQRSALITPSYKHTNNKDDEEDSSDHTEITDHEEFDAEGSAPSEDQDFTQHHTACDVQQQADNCHSIEDRLSLLVKAAERISASTATSPMSNDKSTSLVIGKNGKPTRPFNACKKEPSVPSVNATPTSLNNSANNEQIPLDAEDSQQQQQQQQQQQNNLLQLLSQHLAQQQLQGNKSPTSTGETRSASTAGAAANKSPQLVINLEDVLNVIMNAASIVSSQSSTPQAAVSPTVAKQAQQRTVSPIPCNNQHEAPFSSKQTTQASHAVSPSVSQPMTDRINSAVSQSVMATTPYDDIISQHTINTYIGLDSNNSSSNGGSDLSEFSSLDSLTKMSLMSSNDFCSQYKKRIQQAKERMLQKRALEEELARQQQAMNEKAKNAKKSRKRTHDVNRSSISTESEDQPQSKANSQHSDMSDTPSVPSSAESTNADIKSNLVRMFLMHNSGSSQSGMSEKQQDLFQMVLSALAANEDTAATPAGSNGTAGQMSPLNGLEIENASGDALLNSYPPKKRHRMQQQQEQQTNSSNPYGSESNSNSNNNSSSMHEITSMAGQQDQQMDSRQQRNKETEAKRMSDETNRSEISISVNGGAHAGSSGNGNTCQNSGSQSTNSGCSLSSSSSSMSTSPTPQSSPSLYMDSASSSSSYGVSSINHNLNRIEINNRNSRPGRALSRNSSNSSSRSNSNNASNTKQASSSSSNKQAAVSNSANSMEAQLALLPRRESRTVIDIDQMSEGPDKDEAYRERRRKNNEAAKRSRDARRAKEDDIALRAAILERENLQLKVEVSQLKQETNKLRCLLYNS